MTVAQLRALLKGQPADAEVVHHNPTSPAEPTPLQSYFIVDNAHADVKLDPVSGLPVETVIRPVRIVLVQS